MINVSTMLSQVGALLLCLSGLCYAGGTTCPQNVAEEASRCSGPYISNYDSIESNRGKLYSGIDIAEMTQLCSDFNRLVRCYNRLRKKCQAQSEKETLEAELEGVADISGICNPGDFLEKYAMSHFCLKRHSVTSDKCYDAYASNTSSSLSRAYRGENFAMKLICSSSSYAIDCIDKNIADNCGKEAAKLVPDLVRPTLKLGDIRCDLLDAQVTTASPVTKAATDTKKLSVYSGQSTITISWSIPLTVLFCAWRTL